MALIINPEFKKLIPDLTTEEYNQLESNLLKDGILDPLVIWNDTIVDGHNRYEIATKHNLTYKTIKKEFDSEIDVRIWMINNQLGRRNMSDFDRLELAYQKTRALAEQAAENEHRGTANPCLSVNKGIDIKKEVAKIAGVGTNKSSEFLQMREKEPELIQEYKDAGKTVKEAFKQFKSNEKKDARESKAIEGAKKELNIDFKLGDFEEVLAHVPDGSVDAIITDPPYPGEYIECWSRLSEFAKRVLKPHGFCVAYSGQVYLPEVIRRMEEHLDYYWTFAVVHNGHTQIVNGTNLMCGWKPILIFQNGKKKIDKPFPDILTMGTLSKDGHDWQQDQSEAEYLISKFTIPGDTVCEPFAGSGTTIKAAIKLGRTIIAAEIDETTYNIAKSGL